MIPASASLRDHIAQTSAKKSLKEQKGDLTSQMFVQFLCSFVARAAYKDLPTFSSNPTTTWVCVSLQ